MPAFDHFAAIAPLYARVTYSKAVLLREIAHAACQRTPA